MTDLVTNYELRSKTFGYGLIVSHNIIDYPISVSLWTAPFWLSQQIKLLGFLSIDVRLGLLD